MVETHRYKGTKKWVYTKQDDRRIANEDTDSTREFKKKYKEWIDKKQKAYHFQRFVRPKRVVIEKPHRRTHPKVPEKYKREVVSKRPEEEKHRKPFKPISTPPKTKSNIVPIILAILVILFIAALVNNRVSEKDKLNTTEENLTIMKQIPKSISFEEHLDKMEEYKFKTITLLGRVVSQLEGTKGVGAIEYYVTDDSKNKIRLTTLNKDIYLKIKNAVFNSGSNPGLVFSITGTVKRTFGDYYIEVRKIVQGERSVELVKVKIKEKPEIAEKTGFNLKIENIKKKFSEVIGKFKVESEEIYKKAKIESKETYEKVKSEVDEFLEIEEVAEAAYEKVVDERPLVKIEYSPYSSEEDSEEAIEYINQLREDYGKKPIKFDERVYRLALARAKDMSEQKYLDHVNPYTGECPDNIKREFGLFSNEYVAENAFGNPDYPGWHSTEIEAIDSWMGSRGHRYNLMYDGHTGGAVACYKNMCSFLGLNRDMFGSGCHTGEEGMAFWATNPIQPGEV